MRLLAPMLTIGMKPLVAEWTHLDLDQGFCEIPAWGRISHVFDQDMSNLPQVQRGLRSGAPERATLVLGQFQEQRVALLHEFVEGCINECGQ